MVTSSLSVMLGTYPQTRALKDLSVVASGLNLDFVDVEVIDGFRRMVRNHEFDVAEMSLCTYFTAREHLKPLTAIPVFPKRSSPLSSVVVNVDSGIQEPRDLEGR